MHQTPTDIDELKKRHEQLDEELYSTLLLDWQTYPEQFKAGQDSNPHLAKFRDFVRWLRATATEVKYVDDYTWLAKALVHWHQTFTSVLEVPLHLEEEDFDSVLQRPIEKLIPDPPHGLRNRPEKLENDVRQYSQLASLFRRLERGSTEEEQYSDWHQGEVILSCDVLEGKIDFVQKVGKEAFKHLEAVWLKEVIEVMAYFRYIDKNWKREEPNDHKANYFHACEYYRWRLIDSHNKYGWEYFDVVSAYLQEKLLDSDKKLHPWKSKGLIGRKAELYHNRKTFQNAEKDWQEAEKYVKAFYENIIPAVGWRGKGGNGVGTIDGIEAAKRRMVEAILWSEGSDSPLSIMNAFEAAIAIYFLKDLRGLPDEWYRQASTFEERLKKQEAVLASS